MTLDKEPPLSAQFWYLGGRAPAKNHAVAQISAGIVVLITVYLWQKLP